MDLLNLQPNKVSKDLSGYIIYIYGSPKVGKTTFASKMDNVLLLATEPGYKALPGVYAQDITSWTELKQACKELKKPEVKEHYKVLAIDTVDLASEYCVKYICNQNDINDLGELPYGQGWDLFKKEFKDTFRSLAQMGYAIVFLGHEKESLNDDGTKTIRPNLSNSVKTIISGMADIYGYAHQKEAGKNSVLTLRSSNGSIQCGSRFKYMPEEIDFSYEVLAKALTQAIESEAAEYNGEFITEERISVAEEKTYDYDALMAEFKEMVNTLMETNQSNAMKITAITEKYLGRGKKASDCTPNQAEHLSLINEELRELL